MAKQRTIYACQTCGAQAPKWLGRCPECSAWNSYVEERAAPSSDSAHNSSGSIAKSSNSKALPLSEIAPDDGNHQPIGIHELDRVLGGGFVPGSVILLGGDPGIGKSTLITQALAKLAAAGRTVLYVSGEESAAQIALRARRLGLAQEQMLVLAENDLSTILRQIEATRPHMVVIDSIQTVYSADIESAPGTVSQVRECAGRLLMLAKSSGTACALIGHVTKEGAIAGPKVLEHMVDAVLYFEGERGHPYRILRTIKNRFGSTNEIGVFEMTGKGMREVPNPSGIFLTERPKNAAGSAVIASLEGSRPMLLELQALAASSGLATPRRTAIGVDPARAVLLIAVLEKVAGMRLCDQDVFVNVAGGVKVAEPAADLGLLCAIASSFRGRPIDAHTVLIGEVGLTGEVRSAMGLEARMAEARQLGFSRAVVPRSALRHQPPAGMECEGVGTIQEALDLLL